jgi:ABC-type uncharacterized transport system involved in gliding motility auxiliary subunit
MRPWLWSVPATRSIVADGITSVRRRGPNTAIPMACPATSRAMPPSALRLNIRSSSIRASISPPRSDRQGPVALGAAVSAPATEPPTPASGNATPDAPKPESRIVTTGDSDFVANYAIGIQGNQDFFLNSVNWLAQQENLIAIRPRDAQDRRITLTADQQQRIMLLSLLVIPGLVFAAGGYTWWRRR